MRISARLTRNTSLSMGPIGWLIAVLLILTVLFRIAVLVLIVTLVLLALVITVPIILWGVAQILLLVAKWRVNRRNS